MKKTPGKLLAKKTQISFFERTKKIDVDELCAMQKTHKINTAALIKNSTDETQSWFVHREPRTWRFRTLDWKKAPETVQKKVNSTVQHVSIDNATYASLKNSSLTLDARTPEGIITEIFGSLGDKSAPPFPLVDGFTPDYSTAGPPYPERTSFNYLLNALYALGFDINAMGGALQWDTAITYAQYAVVTASDGQLYIAATSQAGNDPVNDTGANWLQVPSRQEADSVFQILTTLQSDVAALQTQVAFLQTLAPIAMAACNGVGLQYGDSFNLSTSQVTTGIYLYTFDTPQPDTDYKIFLTGNEPTSNTNKTVLSVLKSTVNFRVEARVSNAAADYANTETAAVVFRGALFGDQKVLL